MSGSFLCILKSPCFFLFFLSARKETNTEVSPPNFLIFYSHFLPRWGLLRGSLVNEWRSLEEGKGGGREGDIDVFMPSFKGEFLGVLRATHDV